MGAAASIEGYVSLSLDSIIFLLSCLIYLLLNALALSSFRSKPIDASDLRSLTLQESKAEIMRLRAELGHLGNYYDLDQLSYILFSIHLIQFPPDFLP